VKNKLTLFLFFEKHKLQVRWWPVISDGAPVGDTGQNPILHNRNPPKGNLTLSCGSNVIIADGLPYLPTGNQHCRVHGKARHGTAPALAGSLHRGLAFFFKQRDRHV